MLTQADDWTVVHFCLLKGLMVHHGDIGSVVNFREYKKERKSFHAGQLRPIGDLLLPKILSISVQ